MKRSAAIGVVGIAIAGAVAVWLHYDRRTTEERAAHDVCRVCGSFRTARTAAVDGVQTQASTEIRPSHACSDLLGDDHRHDWAFDYSNSEIRKGWSVTHVHGDGFPGHNGPLPNRFTTHYNRDASFRDLVQARIAAGVLSRDLTARIVLLTDLDATSDATTMANALLAESR